MRIGNADFRIGAVARFPRKLERYHARYVALHRQHLQIEHQPRMISIGSRDADGPIEVRQLMVGGVCLSMLDTALHFTHRVQVLIDLVTIAGSEFTLKTSNVLVERIQEARTLPHRRSSLRRRPAFAEERFENNSRMGLGRKRAGRRRPG